MKTIKGLIVQLRLDYLEEHLDPEGYKRFLGALSPHTQEVLKTPVPPSNSYSFSIIQEIDEKLPQFIDLPLEALFRDIGRHAAPKIVDRYFYNYVETREAKKFLEQFQRLYPILWGFGTVTAKAVDSHPVVFDIQFFYDQDIHKPYCWFMQSFLESALSLFEKDHIQLTEKECDAENGDKCWYRIQWNEE